MKSSGFSSCINFKKLVRSNFFSLLMSKVLQRDLDLLFVFVRNNRYRVYPRLLENLLKLFSIELMRKKNGARLVTGVRVNAQHNHVSAGRHWDLNVVAKVLKARLQE